ncbi:methyltransferase [Colletotrichum fructicola RNA virus 1]|nr:methyltransferase [Colletotrichum fructicola RNA virus 1]
MTDTRGSSEGFTSPEAVRPMRFRKGQKNPAMQEPSEAVIKFREAILSTASVTDINLRSLGGNGNSKSSEDESVQPVPLRSFEVGGGRDMLEREGSSFLRTGFVGKTSKKATPIKREVKELMNSPEGWELRKENTRYGRTLAAALSNRGLIMGKRVLFLGSGCGKVMARFFQRSPLSVLCVDSDDGKIEQLRGMVSDLGYGSFVHCVCGDATKPESFTTVGEKFDVVIVTKSMGSILSGSDRSAVSLMSLWSELMEDDGVMFVDSQTGALRSPNGKLSGIFSGKEADIATVWGRYDDVVYDVDHCATQATLVVREIVRLMVRLKGSPLLDYTAQLWDGYLLSKEPKQHIPTVLERQVGDFSLGLSGFDLAMKGGIDALPASARGSKMVPWSGVGEVVTRKPIFPKFDGVPGLLVCTEGQATFTSGVVVLCKKTKVLRGEYVFLCELVACESPSKGGVWLPVILGVISVGGISYDPNDMGVLERERRSFEGPMSEAGILTTSSSLMFYLRGNKVELPVTLPTGESLKVYIPVDGLNVSMGGSYGNFLKPPGANTLDLDMSKDDTVFELSLALAFSPEYTIERSSEGGVWEYALEGEVFVPKRKRPDKTTGNTPIRNAQDISACVRGMEVFPGVKTVSELYEAVVNRLETYKPTWQERKSFFVKGVPTGFER